MGDQVRYVQADQLLITRADTAAREIDVRLLEWDVPADPGMGDLEMFARGTRIHTEGGDVDAVVRRDHADPPVGRVTRVWSEKDGPYATLKISRTGEGDAALELASDGTYKGPSIGFAPTEPASWKQGKDGRRIAVRKDLDLREVSLTWRPAHKSAAIIAVRAGGSDMTESTAPNAAPDGAAPPAAPLPDGDVRQLMAKIDGMAERFAKLEERARKDVDVPPAGGKTDRGYTTGQWVRAALQSISGERIPDLEMRALADVIITGNEGVVPKQIRSEVLGIIDPARPFLQSTRQVDAGDAGMTMTFPRIVQRPVVGKQTAEKAELPSQATEIDTVDFGAETYGGAGDLSMQLLKRSSPAFLQLWLELLAEQYAINTDDAAIDALLAAGVSAGTGAFDPEAPTFGESFTNAMATSRLLLPDRIWLSTPALAAMIDAKTPSGGGGSPMFPGLVQMAGIDRPDGQGGPLPIRLTPVHVPALDDEAVDVIIGPSRGFAWAEDGTYQLQADVPSKFGKDVGLAGIIWFMPVYPAAFTTYALPTP